MIVSFPDHTPEDMVGALGASRLNPREAQQVITVSTWWVCRPDSCGPANPGLSFCATPPTHAIPKKQAPQFLDLYAYHHPRLEHTHPLPPCCYWTSVTSFSDAPHAPGCIAHHALPSGPSHLSLLSRRGKGG